MIQNVISSWLVCSLSLYWLLATSPTVAQIVPDNTLPVNSVVTPQGNTNLIEGGTVAGGNLFHSFQEFSVSSGETALFNNSLNIQNILTRITGKSISNINGLLKANGNANLFLLNPNGIIFGSNAELNIGGSFVATTASSIKFADGSEFSTINPQSTSLLSITVPLGLQFPPNTANIINRSVNLQGTPGKTVALVGGNMTLESSQLTATQGRIELGSVGSNSLVSLNPTANGWILGYGGISNFGNVQLLSQSTVSASGGDGEIFVRAKDLTVANGSRISVETFNTRNAGRINVQADRVEVTGASADGQVFSTIAATSRGSGNSGSINITTNRLIARDGGDVSVTTFNSGQGGDITVNASESVELIGDRTSPDGQIFTRSGLFAATEGIGTGGNITINTPKLRVLDGARVSVSTRGRGQDSKLGGQGGNLFVRAGEIELSGTSADNRFISGLFALSGEIRPNIPDPKVATGDGGSIKIETGQLFIRNGARVSTATEGVGRGGDITVKADTINITGASTNGQVFSTLAAPSNGTGNSGNITIDTRLLKVTDGADVSVTTFNSGQGGNFTVNASESVELIGAGISPDGKNFSRSGLFAATEGTGIGGNVTITTPKLQVLDGARVSVSTRGAGQDGKPGGRGGILDVRAEEIELSGTGADNRFISGLFALSGEIRPNIPDPKIATGDGGSIKIDIEQLLIRNGAQVSTATEGVGQGGNITVKADAINITGASTKSGEFSTLAAPSRGRGNSGNITIDTRLLKVTDGADVSVTAFGTGGSGNLTVNASELVELIGVSAIPNSTNFSRSGLFAATEGTKNGGSLSVNTDRLVIRDGARISASTRGKGENSIRGGTGGNLTINATDAIELSGVGEVQLVRDGKIETRTFASGLFALSGEERPNIRENEATGDGGNLVITTGLLSIRDGSQVSVSARGSGQAGNLEVQARSIKLKDGSIIGTTVIGNGANIVLQVQDSLQLLGNSQISTNASSDNGGNITITADTIAILEGSSIRADAGRLGGNVRITTQGLFGLPGTITTRSALGVQFDGVIEVNTTDFESRQGLIEVPENFLSPDNQVAEACASEQGESRSQLFVTGRGGLPPSPTEPLSSETVRVSSAKPRSELRQVQKPGFFEKPGFFPQPATGLTINTKGEVILTANAPNFTNRWLPTANCHVR